MFDRNAEDSSISTCGQKPPALPAAQQNVAKITMGHITFGLFSPRIRDDPILSVFLEINRLYEILLTLSAFHMEPRSRPDSQYIRMEASVPTTEKKDCKTSSLDGNSFSELPKKPSPSSLARGTNPSARFPFLLFQ
ncbi:zinc finger GLI2-like protein [Labeo rohita]|uniref:Zinc finger GLI2-like protein n=1 Tax=Labeo rohita TaxID=84645 RepID=A0A498MNH0_LABRO|nr:zinc finger GLI2-like protein [Labeo rohita]